MSVSTPYGPQVTLAQAKRAAEPTLAEASKHNLAIIVAVVDASGNLVYYEKMDDAMHGSAEAAIAKARSSAAFKRPTKAFEDLLTSGGEGLRILRLPGAIPVQGGIPLIIDGKIVGAIGVSGATSAEDTQCAEAGAAALK